MEAESITSLSPLIDQADQWGEVLLLLPLLVALEVVLSADNAIALAAISRRLKDPQRQGQALNFGLALALVFRLLLIVAAQWVIDYWPLQLAAALYLFWLAGTSLLARDDDGPPEAGEASEQAPTAAHAPSVTLGSVVATLAVTDLAFSLDSVAAAVAVSDRLWLVMAGGAFGVLALRVTAGLFVRWLAIFQRLEKAGYLAVALVGLRLMLRLIAEDLVPPEWVLLLTVAALFAWGFSRRLEEPGAQLPPAHSPGPLTQGPQATGPELP
ncbi:TerC family protein [Cyanobium sp. ATX-6F1]|uniref:TerC family protein n=1 Tax=Cyanobium sp. ATX-6F1 TaxID=3137388 RepID=UPI0039BE3AB0